jgi:hypothetical protein
VQIEVLVGANNATWTVRVEVFETLSMKIELSDPHVTKGNLICMGDSIVISL